MFASCDAAIYYGRQGSKLYMMLYDLEKALDNIEYDVLLDHLYQSGVNARLWWLIKSWYTNPTSRICFGSRLSAPFEIHRGVRQGSVLSPTLFLVAINPLLTKLVQFNQGVSIANVYVGSMVHADDIRSVTSTLTAMEAQSKVVQQYAVQNCLRINTAQCEFLTTSHSTESVVINSQSILNTQACKCLGIWFDASLMGRRAIKENIKNARKPFFAYGSIGAFRGLLNPLSGKSILETCVIPTLLYGCELWCLTDSLINTLERFQCEIGR